MLHYCFDNGFMKRFSTIKTIDKMRKRSILAIGTALVGLVLAGFVAFKVADLFDEGSGLLKSNVEALMNSESSKEDGALWSTPDGSTYCCGPGNVRDCSTSSVPGC